MHFRIDIIEKCSVNLYFYCKFEFGGKMKINRILAALAMVFTASSVFAGSIDYLSNQSADYLRTFCRNASTDADSVHYNPAATAFMKDGVTLYLSSQTILKTYSSELTYPATEPLGKNDVYESTKPSPIVPNFYGIYKKDNYAVFVGAGLIAGGGSVNYKDGVPAMVLIGAAKPLPKKLLFQNGNLKGSSLYYFGSAGGSYDVNETLSVSFTARFVYAKKTFKGEANYLQPAAGYAPATLEVDAEKTAKGIGGIIGVTFKQDAMILAARFETPTRLNFKTKVHDGKSFDTMFEDGSKERYDLPAMIGLGGSYTIDKLMISTSFDGFLLGLTNKDDDGYSEDYSSFGWEISASAEYAVIPDFLKVSAGYMYANVGGNSDTYNDFDYSLDSHSVGIGGRITPVANLDLVLGIGRIHYVTANGQKTPTGDITTKYKKDVWNFAFGAEYRI